MERHHQYKDFHYYTYSPESDVDEHYYYHEGRKRAVKGSSILSCDDEELARQDNVHNMALAILGSHCFGPVEYQLSARTPYGSRRRVLELGSGTGSWTRDMARMYRHVEFTGIDVLPVPPPAERPMPSILGGTGGPTRNGASGLLVVNSEDTDTETSYSGSEWSSSDRYSEASDDTVAGDTWGPDGYIELPNVRFFEKDVLDGLDAPDNYYDVIYSRFVFGVAMQAERVPWVINELTRVLKPGGLLLLVESSVPFTMSDGSPLPEGSAFSEAYEASRLAVREMGVDPDMNTMIEPLVRATNDFTELEVKYVPLPLGPWPEDPRLRELGYVGLASIRAGIRSIIPILRQSGYDDGRLSWLMSRLDREFDSQQVAKAGLSWHCTHLWARKKGWLVD